MKTVKLGKQGLEVTAQGYGCMGLTSGYGYKPLSDEAIVEMLKKVYENGVTFWDTANIYVYPEFSRLLRFQSPIVVQEELIGKALKEVGRENIVMSSKTGVKVSLFPKPSAYPCGEPAFIRQQCEASLQRLGTDYLDMFYLHRIDQKIPIEITVAALRDLVKEGKVKYIGLSECAPNTIRRAHKVHPISAVQLEYSLWERGIEKEIFETCNELGIGIVAYSPLGRGFLTGTITSEADVNKSGDFRAGLGNLKGQALENNLAKLQKVQKMAEEKNVTTAQLALAWVMNKQDLLKGNGVVPIPGTTKEKNLLSNLAAADIVLTKEEMAALEAAVQPEEDVTRYAVGEGHETQWENDKNPELPPEEAAKYYA